MPRPDWSLWGIIPGFFFLSWRKNLLMNARTDMSKFQDSGFSEFGVLFLYYTYHTNNSTTVKLSKDPREREFMI